jgi:hypothetical protein
MDQRLEWYLKKQSDVFGSNLALTHQQIANDINSSREVVSRLCTYMEINDPSLYESMTGKKARKPLIEVSDSKEEVKKIDTSYDDLYPYQKNREAERETQLEMEREK